MLVTRNPHRTLTVTDTQRVLLNARRGIRRGQTASGRPRALVEQLDVTVARTRRIIDQTRIRLAGHTPNAAIRLVSLHDPDARPIAKGRLGIPVEFGYKAQVIDNIDGLVLDHSVHLGNPADAGLLTPRSPGRPPSSAGHPQRSRPTAATAKPRSTPNSLPSA
jgi:IS5 family transposase